MYAIFVTGTAGSGKSLLTARLLEWYHSHDVSPISVNLDPGVSKLQYDPDVDVRELIDYYSIMEDYNLGPNGSLILANDLISTKIGEIQDRVQELNPDYVIVDTPGQIELFAFRSSGPYFISNFYSDIKVALFTMDGTLATSPISFVSLMFLSQSIKLRLNIPQINVLTKRDKIIEKLPEILRWSNSIISLQQSLDLEKEIEQSLISKDLIRTLYKSGNMISPIAVSNMTMNGMINLSAALSRILTHGEKE
ncbi:MAG: ATP/GTP-binding protein [Candidatus Nitrosocosmicus sp.]|jgi:GTPase SAR1 family protein|uniref:ATP/GTP-binding protein n=1 Tax=Candidatus Nitrosocosmicus agrestis TaxID=2563600 RepID=UPI00122E3FE1|nr:ATP/GTP-binding protein [Candidatus Nitrosocosmicus sp. SS]KAA2279617.1 GTPase [Candidatus Nitrosocosmicus sp. SS]KAF0868230.1 GTPase [Candidatus Nitrosocosmicus sp. SS]MDR4489873.1 ATP/GTP-binding protein [Candidatus Nitrosocosmicus sp.]